jgi:hypothetical protein
MAGSRATWARAAPVHRLACLALVAALACAGAAHGQSEGGTEPFDDDSAARGASTALRAQAILPGVDANAPMDVARARALQDAVKIAREDADDTLTRERIACYRTFFVNRCLAGVRVRERQIESRLDRIEVAVNRTLREADALDLNRRAAQALAERDERADTDAARREPPGVRGAHRVRGGRARAARGGGAGARAAYGGEPGRAGAPRGREREAAGRRRAAGGR